MNSNGMQELTDRLSHYMKTWGMGLEDAMSEIVADSCDQILANETVMQHIQETDKNLYTEVKGFVKNLVERIKQAVTGMSGSASRDARALAQSANEIAKVWLGAYDEALTGVVQQETEQMKDSADEKYSKAEKDYQFAPEFENAIKLFKKCVNNNDFTEFKNTYGENSEIIIGETFQVLQDIGVDNKPMVLDQEHLHKGMDKDAKPNHRITPAELMEIIRKANNPVAIIKSRSENRKNDSVVIIVDHLINDDITMVPVRVSTEANVNNVSIDVNYMASAYSNDKMHNLLIDAVNTELGLNPNEIGKPGIFYVNKNKADFLKSKGVQFPSPIKNNGLMHKITDNPDFVNQRTLYYKETEKVMNTIRKSQAELADKNNEGAVAGSKAIDTGNKEQAVTPSTHDIINDMASLVKLDQEYEDAANSGDIKKTTEMLLKKLADTQGVIPFMAPEWDAGEAGRVARQLKLADPEAIAKAADKMSDYVPDNAVLIPMPGHEGKLTADSWSVKLAKAISERTGRPVVIALEGAGHESRQLSKQKNEKGVSQEELGFRQVEDLPEGTFPIFVDNEVGTGVTADAARQAIGGGITLAYTKSLRSPGIQGLKNLVVTHESQKNGGGLIPLSERLNTEKRDVRYSKAELDDRYMQAVEQMPDTDSEGNKLTDAQREFFKGSKAVDSEGRLLQLYHGTPSGGFRTFNNKKGTYWFAETRETARTYSKIVGDIAPSHGQELDATDQWLEEMNGGIYVSYLDMKNPQVIDAKRAKWDNIVIDGQKWSTDELADRAKQEGYDGLIIRNVMDEGDYRNPLNPTYSNVYAVFRPNQIKSVNNTEPTQDNDIRWSRSEESYDVEAWLGNMTYSGLQTEDERILMETFKGLRVSMSLALHKQVMYQERIKELEKRTVLDADARHELETLRQKLEGQRWRMGQLEKEMADVTSQEGYAGMMYKHNMLFKDFIDGKTQEQVTEKVNELMAQVKDANRDIEKQTAEMRKLAQTQAVKTMKSYLGKTSLDRMATTLKKQYNSAMPKTEVEDRLAYMALKLADGQDIQADAEGLAAE